jgi:hypothetical protein
MSATKADIPVETLILHVTLQKNQLNLMGLVHAMRSNGPLPQVHNKCNYYPISNSCFWIPEVIFMSQAALTNAEQCRIA